MKDAQPLDDPGRQGQGEPVPMEVQGDLGHHDIDKVSRRFDVKYLKAAEAQQRGAHVFKGRVGVQSFPSGLSVCTSDVLVRQFTRQAALIPRSTSIAVLLEGSDIDTRLSARKGMHMKAGSAVAVNLADTELMSSEVAPGTRARTIILRCTPDALLDEELSDAVTRFTRCTQVESLPFSGRARALADQVLTSEGAGLCRRLMTESFALEMLAGMICHLSNRAQSSALGVTRRERAQLNLVHDMIQDDPGADHSLISLAAAAGMSVSSLKRKFPLVFGRTVGAYVRDARLDQARAGLVGEGWSVAQAAHLAGYAHVSNFTAAFRRRYGVTPGALSRI